MERLLRITNKLLRPRLVLLAPLAVISAAALAAVFTLGLEDTAMAYASYVLSAYSLTAVTLRLITDGAGVSGQWRTGMSGGTGRTSTSACA